MGKNLSGAVRAQLKLQSAMDRLRRTGKAADLDPAIEASQQVLAVISAADPGRAGTLSNLGILLRDRFERTGALADLNRAVEVDEQAVAETPPGHPNRAGCLSNLGISLLTRYRRIGAPADLNRAVEAGEQAVAAAADSPNRAVALSNLLAILKIKFEGTGSAAGLDQVVEVGEQAVAATPADSPNRPMILNNLGIALRARSERTGALADLDRAVEAGEQAVAETPADSPNRAMFMNNLGLALRDRSERTGALADLDRAIDVADQAVAAAPSGSPDRAMILSNLGIVLRARFERTGALADLDLAIETSERALAASASDHADRYRPLATLGEALRARFERTGALADLDRAIQVDEQALDATKSGHPNYPVVLTRLGLALRARFERTGAQADLDLAIDVSEQAVDAFPSDHPKRAGCLSNLGSSLMARYERTGTLADLDRAIEVEEQAVAATPPDHPDRAAYLSNLGISLASRSERTGAQADLDRAIEFDEQAVAETPTDHPSRVGRLSNLGVDLQIRFARTGLVAALDRAIEVEEQAVAETPPDHPHRAAYMSNFGIALRARFGRTGLVADLDRAIEVEEQAVAETPPDHPDRAGRLANLCAALWSRFERTDAAADRERIIQLGREGAAVLAAAPIDRARAARVWADFAAVIASWDVAVEGYAVAVGLLAQIAPRTLERSDQEYWLGELGGLAERAAACCLQAGRMDEAVELWEQGRGILLGQALDTRTDLTLLKEKYPHLATQFGQLRDELDKVTATMDGSESPRPTAPGGTDPAGQRRKIDRRRYVAEQLDHVIAEIRSQPGFARFLQPLPVEELLPASGDGPVVLVNLSHIRSDALVLTSAGVQAVPLLDLTPPAARNQVQAFMSALTEINDPATDPDRRARAEQQLSEVLGWLWDAVTSPILSRLGLTGPPAEGGEWPRLWWCPSGPLAFLPLHAAGYHATHFDAAPQTVLDRVMSSYTPTVRALIHSRRPLSARTASASTGGLLIVAMPHTPDARDLPGAEAETELLEKLFPGQTTTLTGPQATYDSVATALTDYRWAHFACHAASNLAAPSASYLLLSDHRRQPLTVLDLARLRLDRVELAFLSACATARAGTRLPDEAIQLAAGFQLAGYRHVIATLWPIGDHPAVRIANDVYTDLAATDADAAACALHYAIRRRRNFATRRPSIWAAHIHNGA
jgi:tetratricopeptide (TPR) repeat protein